MLILCSGYAEGVKNTETLYLLLFKQKEMQSEKKDPFSFVPTRFEYSTGK